MSVLPPEEDNIIPFERPALLTGGKGGGDTNWVYDIEQNQSFLARYKKSDNSFICTEFKVVWKGRRGMILRSSVKLNLRRSDEYDILYIDSKTFSKDWDFIEMMEENFEQHPD